MINNYQIQVFNPSTNFIRTVLAEKEFNDDADMGKWFEEEIGLDTDRWAKPFAYRIVADFSPEFFRPTF